MKSLKVSDYMTKRAVTFSVEMTIAEAVEKILLTDQSGGPVLDETKKVIGFLSEQDCITQMLESTYYREQVARVGDIMNAEVMSVKPYDALFELAQKMALTRPRIYPVIDDDGILEGTITRHQVMKAIDKHLHEAYNMPD